MNDESRVSNHDDATLKVQVIGNKAAKQSKVHPE
jgi:hypothetical protein